MCFTRLNEVPTLLGQLGSAMGEGTALKLLLADPVGAFPDMRVRRSVMTGKKSEV